MDELERMAQFYSSNFNESYSSIFTALTLENPVLLDKIIVKKLSIHLIKRYAEKQFSDYSSECEKLLETHAIETSGSIETWKQIGKIIDIALLSYCDTLWCMELYKMVEFLSHIIPRLLVSFKIE